MEVIYTPPGRTWAPVKLAMEEDADVIGISSLAHRPSSGAQAHTLLREAGMEDVQVIVGGIVPPKDEKLLLEAGVARVVSSGCRARRHCRRGSRRSLERRERCGRRPRHERSRREARGESELAEAQARWRQASTRAPAQASAIVNRSGIEVQPLYAPEGALGSGIPETLGFPANTRSRAASIRRCSAGAAGRSAS